jgi:hypothetical protein
MRQTTPTLQSPVSTLSGCPIPLASTEHLAASRTSLESKLGVGDGPSQGPEVPGATAASAGCHADATCAIAYRANTDGFGRGTTPRAMASACFFRMPLPCRQRECVSVTISEATPHPTARNRSSTPPARASVDPATQPALSNLRRPQIHPPRSCQMLAPLPRPSSRSADRAPRGSIRH